jgi:hypothetical protein
LHKLESNTAKESHKLQADAAKESHKLQANTAKESHKLKSGASKGVVAFNHWWNNKVMGGDARRHKMMSKAKENGLMAEKLYKADRRRALMALGWTSDQIAIFEHLYDDKSPESFWMTEYAALYDVLFDASYGHLVESHGRSGAHLADAEVLRLPRAAQQHALRIWLRYYGLKTVRRANSLRLDDESDDSPAGSVSEATSASETKDPQGNVTQVDFGYDPPVITGSDSSSQTSTEGESSGVDPGTGPASGGQGHGTSSGPGGGSADPVIHATSPGGSSGSGANDTSYVVWSRKRFAQEYQQFPAKLKAQLTSLEEGLGKIWVRYGDKVKEFAREKVKEKVKEALGKLPGGNVAVKAMGVFNDLMVAREELAAAPTLRKHPGAKLVTSFTVSERPDQFLEGLFAGPTDIRAIELSRKGFTAWKSPNGEWFYERNPHLRPSEYQIVIRPHGNPTPGAAQPVGITDKAIVEHYLQKKSKENHKKK